MQLLTKYVVCGCAGLYRVIMLVTLPYSPDLENKNSPEFQALAKKIQDSFMIELASLPGEATVRLVRVR